MSARDLLAQLRDLILSGARQEGIDDAEVQRYFDENASELLVSLGQLVEAVKWHDRTSEALRPLQPPHDVYPYPTPFDRWGLQLDVKPPLDPGRYVRDDEVGDWVRQHYLRTGGGGSFPSSRTTPVEAPYPWSVGTWSVDRMVLTYGRMIQQLRPLSPAMLKQLGIKEVTGPERQADVERYAEWMRRGLVAPPISVITTDEGKLVLAGDGHRRRLAAIAADVPLLAWVGDAVRSGTDSRGKPVYTNLTLELCIPGEVRPDRDEVRGEIARVRALWQKEQDEIQRMMEEDERDYARGLRMEARLEAEAERAERREAGIRVAPASPPPRAKPSGRGKPAPAPEPPPGVALIPRVWRKILATQALPAAKVSPGAVTTEITVALREVFRQVGFAGLRAVKETSARGDSILILVPDMVARSGDALAAGSKLKNQVDDHLRKLLPPTMPLIHMVFRVGFKEERGTAYEDDAPPPLAPRPAAEPPARMDFTTFTRLFHVLYDQERQRQERQGVVAIHTDELRERFLVRHDIPEALFDRYLQRLKDERQVLTIIEKKRELLRWAE